MSNIKSPAGLGRDGSRLWRQVTAGYELRPDELATLQDVCELSDMLAALSDAWAEQDKPLTTKGSMGQLVTHPLISEIRAHRMARNVLWKQLKLPDISGARPNQQREAAQSRWAAAHGRSA